VREVAHGLAVERERIGGFPGHPRETSTGRVSREVRTVAA
jgi:hypothetical protein